MNISGASSNYADEKKRGRATAVALGGAAFLYPRRTTYAEEPTQAPVRTRRPFDLVCISEKPTDSHEKANLF